MDFIPENCAKMNEMFLNTCGSSRSELDKASGKINTIHIEGKRMYLFDLKKHIIKANPKLMTKMKHINT